MDVDLERRFYLFHLLAIDEIVVFQAAVIITRCQCYNASVISVS